MTLRTEPEAKITRPTELLPIPTYAFSDKALKRWATNLLTIDRYDDGNIKAKFLWEGSTCGNMGQPLWFVYNIKLSSQINGYHILEKNCHPLEHDSNYQKMCAFRKNGETLLEKIKYHQPLLGQPLAAAINWNPDVLPAGCQCSRPLQDHKWKIVLQTLHYRLHQPQ